MRNKFNNSLLKFVNTTVDEKELIEDAKINHNYDALFNQYHRLVIHLALKYRHTSIPIDDLVQEGFTAILHAVKKYKIGKSKFTTYCYFWIRNYMCRLVSREMHLIRLPEHLMPVMNGVLNNNGDKYREKDKVKARQFIKDTSAIRNGDDGQQSSISKEKIYDRLDAEYFLKKSEHRDILERRFGFTDGNVWTLTRIAQKYKLSKERIRQIINEELKKFQRHYKFKHTLATHTQIQGVENPQV